MAFQRVPDTAELRFSFDGDAASTLAGCHHEFAFHVRDTVNGWNELALVTKLADYGRDWWDSGKNAGAGFRSVYCAGWGVPTISAKSLDVEDGLQAFSAAVNDGDLVGDELSPVLAMLIRFRPDSGVRPRRGFIYPAPGDETKADGAVWVGGFADTVQARINDWRADLNDVASGGVLSWAHVIVSRAQGTEEELAAIRALRVELKEAIRATRRSEAVTALVQVVGARTEISHQVDRNVV